MHPMHHRFGTAARKWLQYKVKGVLATPAILKAVVFGAGERFPGDVTQRSGRAVCASAGGPTGVVSLNPNSMRGRTTVRDLSMFAGWIGLPNDEFLRPRRSI
jgi:hypothetical protein